MADYIKEPNMYGGRYNGLDLATRTREYERDLYLYNIAKSQQNNTIIMKTVDEIIDNDEYDDNYNDVYDEIDDLKDKYMKLRNQKEECETKSKFTPIQDVDWCIILIVYIGALLTIPFESVSTPLAFIGATIIIFALMFGQKVYRTKMKIKADNLNKELRQLRKEIKLKEGR